MAGMLVMDANPHLSAGVRPIRASAGAEVVKAPDGRAGIREALIRGVDRVLVDPVAPVAAGVAGLRMLQTVMPAATMLALTDGRSAEDLPRALAATLLGAHGTVQKPLGAQHRLAVVQAVLTRP